VPVGLSIEGGIASVTIDRPEAMNTVSPEVLAQLHDALDRVDDAGARVCIVSGAGGRAFSAGADIAEMLEFTAERAREQLDEGLRLTRRLETSGFVSIAAISGWALGGGTEILLACALRYAARNAKIGLPEVTVGIFPGWGGVVRLPRQAPRALALDMILSGRILDADEALRAGLVADIVDDPLAAAHEAAERLLEGGPTAQQLAREVIARTELLPLETALAEARDEWLTLMTSEQRVEGHRAFLEKRAPSWKGLAT
jgi:enoyl-CoA hydratase